MGWGKTHTQSGGLGGGVRHGREDEAVCGGAGVRRASGPQSRPPTVHSRTIETTAEGRVPEEPFFSALHVSRGSSPGSQGQEMVLAGGWDVTWRDVMRCGLTFVLLVLAGRDMAPGLEEVMVMLAVLGQSCLKS